MVMAILMRVDDGEDSELVVAVVVVVSTSFFEVPPLDHAYIYSPPGFRGQNSSDNPLVTY